MNQLELLDLTNMTQEELEVVQMMEHLYFEDYDYANNEFVYHGD